MAIDQYLLFLSLVALIVVSPGPTFVLVMQTAASRGIAGGVAIVLGVSVSIAAHYAIALTGMSVILAS
ncbi:LysE family transporter, partial [bacterium]|nr:LysE family transporter [bacterium]